MVSAVESTTVAPGVATTAKRRDDGQLQPLVAEALRRGLEQVHGSGAALQPFLLCADGTLEYLFGDSHCHPIELAARLLLAGSRASDSSALALAMGTRLTTPAGRQAQAVLVLACARTGGDAEVWAQAYRPRRWYRAFCAEGEPWRVGAAVNLFRAAEDRGDSAAPLVLEL